MRHPRGVLRALGWPRSYELRLVWMVMSLWLVLLATDLLDATVADCGSGCMFTLTGLALLFVLPTAVLLLLTAIVSACSPKGGPDRVHATPRQVVGASVAVVVAPLALGFLLDSIIY